MKIRLDYGRDGLIILVACLASLEERIGVLGCAAKLRMFRIHCPFAEVFNCLPIYQASHRFVVDQLDLLYFMACAEPIKEVHKRHFGPERRQMAYGSEVHYFLHRPASHKGKTRLAHCHNV